MRLGARAVTGAEEGGVISATPPSPSPPEEEGWECSKNVPSSRGEESSEASESLTNKNPKFGEHRGKCV